jgi:hypothetical protein
MNFETDPDPEFLAHLEWQVRTSARRESRFARPAATRGWRGLRAVAALLLAFAIGAGGVFAAQQLQQSREADLRAAQWGVRLRLASERLRAAIEDRDEARARFDAGVTGQDELLAAERDRQRVELACARLESEATEVAETGLEPSDRISAPLVGGRDFVRERLEIAAADARAEVQAAEQRQALAQQRHAAGVTSEAEVREANQTHSVALSQERLLGQRLALRAAFVAGKQSALEADLADLRFEAECTVAMQRNLLEAARGDLGRVRTLMEAGVLPRQELRRAERRVAEAEAALRLAELELRVLAGQGQR